MIWLDAPSWVHHQLTTGLPTVTVSPESDASVDRPPCLIWALSLTNPDPLGIWTGNLVLTLLCSPDTAPDLVATIHALADGWRTPGPLNDVELMSYTSSRSGRSERLGQHTFIYSLTWDS